MKARLYKPAKTAMQSGLAKTKKWILTFEGQGQYVEPLMGWVGMTNSSNQIKISFDTQAEAVAYLLKKKINYTVVEPEKSVLKPKSYGDNFKPGKLR